MPRLCLHKDCHIDDFQEREREKERKRERERLTVGCECIITAIVCASTEYVIVHVLTVNT